MKAKILILLIVGLLSSCNNQKTSDKENPILVAQREAPIGWIWLNLYPDSTFEYISGGVRNKRIYTGNFKMNADTILFDYKDSIPFIGSKALISNIHINYLNGKQNERLEIILNDLAPAD
ncbi:hypothetical protein D1614_15320 [Maribellus luteus]|uniref:Uncharacterized protein n=1 Tax=Maribellus luteus TaxID=2305463 RepID=A0A399SWM8_9BACT|nr:hypothetical protein [Maribellus luteus]RIJ47129.1 hypothetical protein D1614_15320 [Maribellus luteus]